MSGYEVQVRRPCSGRMTIVSEYDPGVCLECGAVRKIGEQDIDHAPVYEWVPLEEAMQRAHIESCCANRQAGTP